MNKPVSGLWTPENWDQGAGGRGRGKGAQDRGQASGKGCLLRYRCLLSSCTCLPKVGTEH